jgi:hypothetical protein
MNSESRRTRLVVALAVALATTVLALLVQDSETASTSPPDERGSESSARGAERGPGSGYREAEARRQDQPDLPMLIGLTPDEVRRRVDALGVQTQFVGHCESRPPQGRVIYQRPQGGHKPSLSNRSKTPQVFLTTDVASACTKQRAERRCTSEDLVLRADGYPSGAAGGAGKFEESFLLRNRGSEGCQVEATVSLTLTSLETATGSIRGNPAALVLDWRLRPREQLAGRWVWENWCALHGRWKLRVAVLGMSASDRSGSPVCFERNRASMMLFRGT